MKILPKIYSQAKGEPFLVQDYHGNKIEFYPLDQTIFYSKLVAGGRFHLWTSDGLDFRLFIDQGYYEELKELYTEEMNVISLDYMLKVYEFRNGVRKRTFLWMILALVVVMGAMLGIMMILPPEQQMWGGFIGVALMLLPYYFLAGNERKKIDGYIREEHAKASTLIKNLLGENNFEDLLTKQEKYAEKFFADDEETESEEAEEKLSLDENLESDTEEDDAE